MLSPTLSVVAVSVGTTLLLVWLGLRVVTWLDDRDEVQRGEVIRMMRSVLDAIHAIPNYLEIPKVGAKMQPYPRVEEMRRNQIQRNKLRDMGLSPSHAGIESSDGKWPRPWETYLSLILPLVEEQGVIAAKRETRKMAAIAQKEKEHGPE